MDKGEDPAELVSVAGTSMPVRTGMAAAAGVARSHAAAAVGGLPESMERMAWTAWSISQVGGAGPAPSRTDAAPLAGPETPAERVNWGNVLAALDRSAGSFATDLAGGRSGLEMALSADSRNLAVSGRAPLAFDATSGALAIWGQGAGETIREAVTAGGFLEVRLGQQLHSSDPASAWFDPALAGAGRDSLTGIRIVNNGGDAPLLLASQTLSRGLTVQAHGPVTVLGTLYAGGPVTLAAPAITVRGQLDATSVALAGAGLVNVTATGSVTAAQVAVTAGVFLDAGQVRADGVQGGQVIVQAGNVLQGGRLSADGTAADGGMVQVQFDGAYIATAAALTSADGAHGGQVRIDGGSTGRLFSSGTQEALGRTAAGGLVALDGKQIALAGATADVSGGVEGGTLAIGSGDAGAETVVMAAATLRAAAATGSNDGQVTVGAARTEVHTTSGFHLIDPHPTRSGAFGFDIAPLANGNVVVADPHDDLVAADGGAVYLFQGRTGALLGTLVGAEAGDRLGDTGDAGHSDPSNNVGQAIVPLTNGNYVVRSPNWNNGRGAATWGDGTVGITGAVDDTNSLVGSNPGDQVGGGSFGGGVVALSNGNYVVRSPSWNGSRGAATWGDGTVGVTGAVDDTNSLVGSDVNDVVGSRVTALSNSNYVVSSLSWSSQRGAVTWGDGTVGVTGAVDDTNSLVGSTAGDQVGFGVTALPNGNYVVISTYWGSQRGAVTWGDGTAGITGVVGAGNSLVGNSLDRVGLDGITVLVNSNYVVDSPAWNVYRGAATWADGTAGVTGTVGAGNSLVGSTSQDQVGVDGIVALSDGNYVVRSSSWNAERGAATWGDGTLGITGMINATNSLVGSAMGDQIGFDTTALSNGNYVVGSPQWNASRGAATWADGTAGISGTIDATNSLVGSSPQNFVGSGIVPLTNGNYVVRSLAWNGFRGAVTWGDGGSGITGPVDAGNSLVGTNTDDYVGNDGIVPLPNGNYVVLSARWNGDRGAVTWADGTSGAAGMIDATNSLIGSTAGDRVGFAGVTVLSNSNYVVNSPYWNGGQASGRGAVTWGDATAGVTGTIDAGNSLVGRPGDFVGILGTTALPNGNYVVGSPLWQGGRGAATWRDGTAGVTGTIDAGNSLVGLTAADQVGNQITALSNGNYVVSSPDWNRGSGAATWGDGTLGVIGAVDTANSLVGSNPGDRVSSGGVAALANGNYVVASPSWAGGRGAATWGDGTAGITGAVDDTNSLVG